MITNWICPECDKKTAVTVYPIIPAKVYGPPENCHPEEGGEHEPEECEHCGHAIPNDEVYEQAADDARSAREHDAEMWDELRREDARERKEMIGHFYG